MQRSYGKVVQIRTYTFGVGLDQCRLQINQPSNILRNVVPYKGRRNLDTDLGVPVHRHETKSSYIIIQVQSTTLNRVSKLIKVKYKLTNRELSYVSRIVFNSIKPFYLLFTLTNIMDVACDRSLIHMIIFCHVYCIKLSFLIFAPFVDTTLIWQSLYIKSCKCRQSCSRMGLCIYTLR